MADTKISALPDAAALGGTEEIPGVQGGATKRMTAQDIADLAPGSTNYDALTDTPGSKSSNAGKAPVVNAGESLFEYPTDVTANRQIETFTPDLLASEGNTWTFQKNKSGMANIVVSEEELQAIAQDIPLATEADFLQDDLRTGNVVGGGNITAWIRIDDASGRFSDGAAVDPVGPALTTPATSVNPEGVFAGFRFKVNGVEVKIISITDDAGKAIIAHDGVIAASNNIDFIYGTEFVANRVQLSNIAGGGNPNTELLLQSIDVDSGTVVVDRSPAANSVDNNANQASHSAAQSKFGTTSLFFPQNSSNQAVTIGNTGIGQSLGSWDPVVNQDWTVRLWFQSLFNSGNLSKAIASLRTGPAQYITIAWNDSTLSVKGLVKDTTGTTNVVFGNVSISAFNHIAITYDSVTGTITWYFNGVSVGTAGPGKVLNIPNPAWWVVGNLAAGGPDNMGGYVESFEFIVGQALAPGSIVNNLEISTGTSVVAQDTTKWITPNGGTSQLNTTPSTDYNSVLNVLPDGSTPSFIANGETNFSALIDASLTRAAIISRPGAPGTGVTRNIASNDNSITGQGAAWAFRDNVSVWAAARADTMAAALNQAVVFVNNQMDDTFFKLGDANVIQDPELEAAGGDAILVKGTFAVAIGMNSQNTAVATLENVRINSDGGTEINTNSSLKIKQFLGDNTVNITNTGGADITNDLRAVIIN